MPMQMLMVWVVRGPLAIPRLAIIKRLPSPIGGAGAGVDDGAGADAAGAGGGGDACSPTHVCFSRHPCGGRGSFYA